MESRIFKPPTLVSKPQRGKRRCAANQWKRKWKGRRRAERVDRLCKTNSLAQKLSMTGIHLVQVYGHTAQGASTTQVNAMCKKPQTGCGDGQNPERALWITMWRGFNVDTRRKIRKVCWKKAPILARDPRRWNQAAGPISATICSVLEPGWKPSTPGFWQTPELLWTGADHRQFLPGYGNANMEKSGWAFAQCGYGERYHHRLCQEGQVSADERGNFMAARALDFLVFGAINEPHLRAD